MADRLRAVFFDLGGTVVQFEPSPDWGAIAERLVRAAHQRLGPAAPPLEVFLETVLHHLRGEQVRSLELEGIAIPWADRWDQAFAALGLDIPPELPGQVVPLLSAQLTPTARLAADVRPVLEGLDRRGLCLGIISNTPWDTPGHYLQDMLAAEGLLDLLPVRLFSGDVLLRKPSPRIFQLALDACGCKAEQAAFVGNDMHSDILGALNAGWRAFWWHPTGMEDAGPVGCVPVSSFRELRDALAE